MVIGWLRISNMPYHLHTWIHWLERLAGRGSVHARIILSVLTTLVSSVWRERSARLHGKGAEAVQKLFFKAKIR